MIHKLLIAALLLAGSLLAQNPNTAVYPSAVATDVNLGVACNSAHTTLAAAMSSLDTSFAVANGLILCSPSWVTIDAGSASSEVVKVCSISGNTVSICTSGRGSGALSHAYGASVIVFVDQNLVNQHAAEIKAIETALGANLGNLPSTAAAVIALFTGTADGSHFLAGDGTLKTVSGGGGMADPGGNGVVYRTALNTTAVATGPQLPLMTGDSGSGGTAGAVPAPAIGDAANCLKGSATWGACGSGGSVPGPVPSTGWTWVGQGNATVVYANNIGYMQSQDGAVLHVQYRTAPATPYSVTAGFTKKWLWNSDAATYSLLVRESTTGKMITILAAHTATLGNSQIEITKWTNVATSSDDYYSDYSGLWNQTVLYSQYTWLRITDDGSSLSFWYSLDGYNFTQISTSVSRTDWMASGPDQIGWSTGLNSATIQGASLLQWLAQ